MKRNLAYKILICEVLHKVIASITGVTYMNHFDFEQRYRDVNECNPFYWHPLHLPQECIQMFENLIRSRLTALTPYTVVKEKPTQPVHVIYPYNYIYSPTYTTEYKPEVEYVPIEKRNPSQYETLYELLKRDVQDLPTVPFLGVSPYLGVIAVYKQPVSYKSVKMIKKLARAYDSSDLYAKMQPEINKNNDTHPEGNEQTEKKKSDGNLVVNTVVNGNDAIALLKIKKFNYN